MKHSFLLIKPDAYNRGLADVVRQDILLMCREQSLSVILEKTKTLTTDNVLRIYPDIFKKTFPCELIELMISNLSTLILVDGENSITKTKIIRGYHRFEETEEMYGIRGKYCYTGYISTEEASRFKQNNDPRAKQLIDVIIGGIVHAPDTPNEVSVISDVFG